VSNAVRSRPWPPCFQLLTDPPTGGFIPFHSRAHVLCRITLATVPTPSLIRRAISLYDNPSSFNRTTSSLSKIFLGRCGAKFLPDRLWTV
jgi:hypothetical protein